MVSGNNTASDNNVAHHQNLPAVMDVTNATNSVLNRTVPQNSASSSNGANPTSLSLVSGSVQLGGNNTSVLHTSGRAGGIPHQSSDYDIKTKTVMVRCPSGDGSIVECQYVANFFSLRSLPLYFKEPNIRYNQCYAHYTQYVSGELTDPSALLQILMEAPGWSEASRYSEKLRHWVHLVREDDIISSRLSSLLLKYVITDSQCTNLWGKEQEKNYVFCFCRMKWMKRTDPECCLHQF